MIHNEEFFHHDNVIAIRDILKPPSRRNYNDIYIITDLMETDLHRVIYSRQELSIDHIRYFVFQMLRGLAHMHSANVIHRDLKPANLLLNKDCQLKICDLGLARGYNFEEEDKTEYVVTRWYRSPEVILNAHQYTKAIDIWSVGCIIAELLGRTPLFPGEDYLDQVQRVISILGTPSAEDLKYIGNKQAIMYIKSLPKRTKQKWEKLFPEITPALSDLLTKMLCFNPDKRISAEECLEHPFFAELIED